MNKKIKMLTTALLLSGSLLSAVPAHAAITTEPSAIKMESTVSKPSGDITVKSISYNKPSDGYVGRLWCTGNGVYIRDEDGNKIPDGNGGYAVMNRGDSNKFYVEDGRAYYATATGNAYVSINYLSTVRVN